MRHEHGEQPTPLLVLAAALAAGPAVVVVAVDSDPANFTGRTHVFAVGVTALAAVALSVAGARRKDGRAVLTASGFAVMAGLLALHGLATPGVLVGQNGVIAITGGLTLPVGGLRELGGFPPSVRRLVRDHHERLDGTGYPRGLTAEEIDLETRILAACDVYDALISARVYRPAWTHEQAVELLRRESGAAFDPRCVASLEQALLGRWAKSGSWLVARGPSNHSRPPRNRKRAPPCRDRDDLVNLENQVGYLRAVGNASGPTRIPFHLLLVQLCGRRVRTGSSTRPHSNG